MFARARACVWLLSVRQINIEMWRTYWKIERMQIENGV